MRFTDLRKVSAVVLLLSQEGIKFSFIPYVNQGYYLIILDNKDIKKGQELIRKNNG